MKRRLCRFFYFCFYYVYIWQSVLYQVSFQLVVATRITRRGKQGKKQTNETSKTNDPLYTESPSSCLISSILVLLVAHFVRTISRRYFRVNKEIYRHESRFWRTQSCPFFLFLLLSCFFFLFSWSHLQMFRTEFHGEMRSVTAKKRSSYLVATINVPSDYFFVSQRPTSHNRLWLCSFNLKFFPHSVYVGRKFNYYCQTGENHLI